MCTGGFVYMTRRPPGSTRIDTLLPYTSLFRSSGQEAEVVDAGGVARFDLIEGANALDLVAEDIEPQCVFLAARKQIDQPAAHGELARIGNRLDTDIAVRLQPQIGRAHV